MAWRKVDGRLWNDPKIQRLDAQGKLLFIYLCTAPEANPTGIYALDLARAARLCSMNLHNCRSRLRQLVALRMVEGSPDEGLIFVRRMFKYQGSRSPGMLRFVERYLAQLPKSPLVTSFKRAYPGVGNGPPHRGGDSGRDGGRDRGGDASRARVIVERESESKSSTLEMRVSHASNPEPRQTPTVEQTQAYLARIKQASEGGDS